MKLIWISKRVDKNFTLKNQGTEHNILIMEIKTGFNFVSEIKTDTFFK